MSNLKSTCQNCHHFDSAGYETKKQTQHLGFCSRFTQVVATYDKECRGFIPSKEKENHFRNLEKAKNLDILFNNQLQLFDGNII